MSKSMPAQRPHRSEQAVQTPANFLAAVRRLLKIEDFSVDLAASHDNAVVRRFFSERVNALIQPWNLGGWNWLNPPFANLAPWVRKAWEESHLGACTAMLVPAGVGANWWRDWVHGRARVLLLNGRLTFVGHKQPYPKDCALLLYAPGMLPGYETWSWMSEEKSLEPAPVEERELYLAPGEDGFQFMTDRLGAEALAAGVLPGYLKRQAAALLTVQRPVEIARTA